MVVDPARQFWSGYTWVGNNPVMGIDPTGGICPTCPNSPHNESITMLDEVVVTAKRGIQGIGDWFNDLSYPSWNFQGVQTVWTGSGANFQEFAGKFDPSKITLSIDFDMVQDLLNFWGKRSPSDQHNRNNQAPSRESMAKTSVSRASEQVSPVIDPRSKESVSDTISAATVLFHKGSIFRIDTVKNDEGFHRIMTPIDKRGNIIGPSSIYNSLY